MEEEKRTDRRIVMVPVSYDFLIDLITEGWMTRPYEVLECANGLPPGAKFIGSDFDPTTFTSYIVMEHESFDPVPLGVVPPWRRPTIRKFQFEPERIVRLMFEVKQVFNEFINRRREDPMSIHVENEFINKLEAILENVPEVGDEDI